MELYETNKYSSTNIKKILANAEHYCTDKVIGCIHPQKKKLLKVSHPKVTILKLVQVNIHILNP